MSPIERRRLRVPREHRSTLFRPSPDALPALVERNRVLLASYDFRLAGRPFREVRAAARAEIVALARNYTRGWGFEVPDWAEPKLLIVTGHQPRPYHPGVWIKNFLAGELADAVGGVALNLNVDNDEVHGQTVRLPTRDLTCRMGGDEVRTAEVELVSSTAAVPYEEQPASALRPEAVHEVLDLVPSPELGDAFRRCWMHLLEVVPKAANLAEALLVARRRSEEAFGLANLELPVSALSDSAAFRLFLAEMLRRREDFFDAYNASLQEFRSAYHERNRAQPVPDLARDGRRAELPYWVWREAQRRRRLWIEPTSSGGLVLAADEEPIGRLAAEDLADPSVGAERLATLRESGWKIRPRALSMTLFVRLCVGDVFIHGVGGALYDQITDAVIERLFRVRPPELVVASCTVHLPLEAYRATRDDLERARRAVRDWRHNPERMLPPEVRRSDEARLLIEEKRRLTVTHGRDRRERRRTWDQIRKINRRLAALYPDGPDAAERDLNRIEQHLRYNAVLRNREYPFSLYPADDLVAFYRDAVRITRPSGAACGNRRELKPGESR
ncbi:MAG: hypothetical protein WBC59_00330 [Phycisphaerae bacterium]